MDKYRIGKVYISSTSPEHALKEITRAVKEGKNGYICVSNVRTVRLANKESKYRKIMNEAFMCTPDGMPLVWLAHLWGLKSVQRTVGPDLFTRMINDKESGIKHFLLGDTEETLKAMKSKYSSDGSTIVGMYSPPFCDVENYDFKQIAEIINESGADIVWVSLRAPKQDILASKLIEYTNHKLFIGVGAAFRFSLGKIKHPPMIFQKLGLTGIFWRKWTFDELCWYVSSAFCILKWSLDILLSRILNEK